MARQGEHPLHVALDARLEEGRAGGLEQFIIGLAHGLSRLGDGDERYSLLCWPDSTGWIAPYVAGPCRLLPTPPRESRTDRIGRLKHLCRDDLLWGPIQVPAVRLVHAACAAMDGPIKALGRAMLERSDGTIEAAGVDLMHFTKQLAFQTDVPSIYQPHDLQHLHLPQYFSPPHHFGRELVFRTFCHQARMVATVSRWVRDDLLAHYRLAPEKVCVVPYAPVLAAYAEPSAEDLAGARRRLDLPEAFLLYPAQTFPHKNHAGLLEAMALLRRRGLEVHLVCSGRKNDHYPTLQGLAERLGVGGQVQFVGFVSPMELHCLYRLCRGVVIPSKFEAASFPLWEAFLAGAACACSNVTSLPAQAGEAAVVFDPDNTEAIAQAVARLWTDEYLRRDLADRGSRNVARFTWDRTARLFRAHYRRLAGRALTDEDRDLLAAPPLL